MVGDIKMGKAILPGEIPNWIAGKEQQALSGQSFAKLNPANGQELCRVARSQAEDVHLAVEAAKAAQPGWADLTP